jgi:RimJ/RimL family protein N-acetyltransferase
MTPASSEFVPRKLVPEGFDVPERLEHERFTLRMLSVADVAKDFAAINQRVLADGTPDPWDETTFLTNLADLGWHETEFRLRRSFAYTMVRPDESEVVGCVYLNPPRDETHDVLVRYWVTRAAWDEGLHPLLAAALRAWVGDVWPFARPLYEDT